MEETIYGKCACILPEFLAYRTPLTGEPSASFERASNTGPETELKYCI
jgi:hypothetical protein